VKTSGKEGNDDRNKIKMTPDAQSVFKTQQQRSYPVRHELPAESVKRREEIGGSEGNRMVSPQKKGTGPWKEFCLHTQPGLSELWGPVSDTKIKSFSDQSLNHQKLNSTEGTQKRESNGLHVVMDQLPTTCSCVQMTRRKSPCK
jgi:hypothetical protein